MAHAQTKDVSRAGSATDKVLKKWKRISSQDELEKARLEEEDLQNVVGFNYFGVTESGDGDSIVKVNQSVKIS